MHVSDMFTSHVSDVIQSQGLNFNEPCPELREKLVRSALHCHEPWYQRHQTLYGRNPDVTFENAALIATGRYQALIDVGISELLPKLRVEDLIATCDMLGASLADPSVYDHLTEMLADCLMGQARYANSTMLKGILTRVATLSKLQRAALLYLAEESLFKAAARSRP